MEKDGTEDSQEPIRHFNIHESDYSLYNIWDSTNTAVCVYISWNTVKLNSISKMLMKVFCVQQLYFLCQLDIGIKISKVSIQC